MTVHNALDDVKACLGAFAASRPDGCRIVVVDDASDGPTREWLATWAGETRDTELLRQDCNQGYTRSANLALREANTPYVVLANSDTVPPREWAARLVRVAERDGADLVGPMSNAASWQSVPEVFADRTRRDFAVNPLPAGWSAEDMDVLVRATEAAVPMRVPLLNGFFTLIRREVVDTVGGFDEELFPSGYGEENDFAFRAADAGFTLAIATDTYVFHGKSRSFSHDRRRALSLEGSKAFRSRWPKRRIDDAIIMMREHPTLSAKREAVRAGLGTAGAEPSPTNIDAGAAAVSFCVADGAVTVHEGIATDSILVLAEQGAGIQSSTTSVLPLGEDTPTRQRRVAAVRDTLGAVDWGRHA